MFCCSLRFIRKQKFKYTTKLSIKIFYLNKMFHQIFYITVVIICFFGLFLTNFFDGEFNSYIHQTIYQILSSKIFFWICAIFVNLLIIAVISVIISLHYWNFLYENFPERFISWLWQEVFLDNMYWFYSIL